MNKLQSILQPIIDEREKKAQEELELKQRLAAEAREQFRSRVDSFFSKQEAAVLNEACLFLFHNRKNECAVFDRETKTRILTIESVSESEIKTKEFDWQNKADILFKINDCLENASSRLSARKMDIIQKCKTAIIDTIENITADDPYYASNQSKAAASFMAKVIHGDTEVNMLIVSVVNRTAELALLHSKDHQKYDGAEIPLTGWTQEFTQRWPDEA